MDGTVYTVTANLLAETTAYYPRFSQGETHRAEQESFQVGGKGINVSRATHLLNRKTHAVYFPAGCTGARCAEWLQNEPFPSTHFTMAGETREGWVARVPDQPETTFLGLDRPVEPTAWNKALGFLEENLRVGDVLALCGSVPGWNRELSDPLHALLRLIVARNPISIDTYGPPLRELAKLPILLVKINARELETLVGRPVTDEAMPQLLTELGASHPVRNWVVSNGAAAVWARDENGHTFNVMPPRIREVSPVGCGDVLHAAILDALLADSALDEAVYRAVPLAAACAANPGVSDFPLEAIPDLRRR